jgi:hypothetical protein
VGADSVPNALTSLVDAHRFRVAVEVGRELPVGLLVAAGQEEVLTAGGEVRREPASDVAGADDGNRAIRNSHVDAFRDLVAEFGRARS